MCFCIKSLFPLSHIKTEIIIDVLPYGIEGRDGNLPFPLHSLASDEVFGKVVGELTGFSHESFILKVFAC